MVFHNEALLKLVGIESTKDLHALLSKQMFVSQEQGYNLSLLAAAQSRYSDLMLGQTYKYVDRSFKRDRIISFQRNEVIFDGKKSIVINVRDLTDQQGLFESKAKIQELNQAVERLSHEITSPLAIVNESVD